VKSNTPCTRPKSFVADCTVDNMSAGFYDQLLLSRSHAKTVIVVCLTIAPLAAISVLARMLSRWRYVGLKMDDWFMLVTMVWLVRILSYTADISRSSLQSTALRLLLPRTMHVSHGL
jgi:hypothetical protein